MPGPARLGHQASSIARQVRRAPFPRRTSNQPTVLLSNAALRETDRPPTTPSRAPIRTFGARRMRPCAPEWILPAGRTTSRMRYRGLAALNLQRTAHRGCQRMRVGPECPTVLTVSRVRRQAMTGRPDLRRELPRRHRACIERIPERRPGRHRQRPLAAEDRVTRVADSRRAVQPYHEGGDRKSESQNP